MKNIRDIYKNIREINKNIREINKNIRDIFSIMIVFFFERLVI
ncbi:MAG: hypothetical protein PHV65_08010 [Bacteroidales bacterium]|nr:hypothetical protein [Bacteroidales bacterium]